LITFCGSNQYLISAATTTSNTICGNCGCDANAQCIANVGVSLTLGVQAFCPALGASFTASFSYRCQCNTGFAGNGFFCGVDSDTDGFPDFAISSCTSSCFRCVVDPCPLRADIQQQIFIGGSSFANRQYDFKVYPDVQLGTAVGPKQDFAVWSRNQAGTITSTRNAEPSALVSDYFFAGVDFYVDVTSVSPNLVGDDGAFGLVWGFNSDTNFTYAQWKRTDSSTLMQDAPSGWNLRTTGTRGAYYDSNSEQHQSFLRSGLNIHQVTNTPIFLAFWHSIAISGTTDQFAPNVTYIFNDVNRNSWIRARVYGLDLHVRPNIQYQQIQIYDITNGVVNPPLFFDTGAIRLPVTNGGNTFTNPVPTRLPGTGRIGLWTNTIDHAAFSNIEYYCCDGWVNASNNACTPYRSCSNGVQTEGSWNLDRVCRP